MYKNRCQISKEEIDKPVLVEYIVKRIRRTSVEPINHTTLPDRGKLMKVLKLILARIPWLLSTLMCWTAMAFQSSGDSAKSVVLKATVPPQSVFIYQRDRSEERLWEAFSVVKKANTGDPVAEHELGLRYLLGKDFYADTAKAAMWIQRAADQDLLPAHYNFGILLNNGWGVPWNPFEAYRHFEYAAKHGMREARYVYGLFFTDNLVVERNYPEAHRWISMAADSGYAPAKEVLEEFRKRGINVADTHKNGSMNPGQSPPVGSTLQPVYLDFSSDSVPTPDAQSLLRDAILEKGRRPDTTEEHLPMNSDRIQSIFRTAEAGSPEALTLLGYWYEHGIVVHADVIRASAYYLRAMRLDAPWAPSLLWRLTRQSEYFIVVKNRVALTDPVAEFVWADLAISGFDNQLTRSQAIQFLEDASSRGYAEASVQLALCYYAGTWVSQDRERGRRYLEKASNAGDREAQLRLLMVDLVPVDQGSACASLMETLNRATEDGSVLAETMLGYCYRNGICVPASIARSVLFYRKAAQRGNQTAYAALKEMYDEIRPGDAGFEIHE